MTSAKAESSGNRRKSFASRAIIFVALLAFALQSYIAQTHIHGLAPDGIAKIAAEPSPGPAKIPLDKSPADCPFCQAVNLAGAFLTPAALLVLLPLSWVDSISHIFIAREAAGDTAHDWQSRAPPRR